MIDPRQIAAQIPGAIDWQTEVSGFCQCPGEALHTSAKGQRDRRVNIGGAPTPETCWLAWAYLLPDYSATDTVN
jgi:hypothetical protein